MNIEHIEKLMYNPFFLSKVLHSFLTGYEKEADIKTLFFVLPTIMYEDSRTRLAGARSDSTLYSLFTKDFEEKKYGIKINGKFSLSGIADLFEDFAIVTKQSIIILSNENKIDLTSKITLKENFIYSKTNIVVRDYFKSAYYLGKVLTKIDIKEFEALIVPKNS